MAGIEYTIVLKRGYLDPFDQQFQYGREFSCSIFFLSQNLIDFLMECFDGS